MMVVSDADSLGIGMLDKDLLLHLTTRRIAGQLHFFLVHELSVSVEEEYDKPILH